MAAMPTKFFAARAKTPKAGKEGGDKDQNDLTNG